MKNFTEVTEIPGQRASKDQMSYMMTRYHLAKKYSNGKDVLEIGCGSGTGLGYLAEDAKNVIGGDIDSNLVNIASLNYKNNVKVTVQEIDAQAIPFKGESFDLVILFEAIYYVPNVEKFITEVKRVIRPKGVLIISSVNCEWHGFNKSPFSIKYYNAKSLVDMFASESKTKLFIGFEDSPRENNMFISHIRQVAVKLGLIPKTMRSKELLKRLFYGKLTEIPKVIYDGLGEIENLVLYEPENSKIENYKFLYLVAHFN